MISTLLIRLPSSQKSSCLSARTALWEQEAQDLSLTSSVLYKITCRVGLHGEKRHLTGVWNTACRYSQLSWNLKQTPTEPRWGGGETLSDILKDLNSDLTCRHTPRRVCLSCKLPEADTHALTYFISLKCVQQDISRRKANGRADRKLCHRLEGKHYDS